MTSSDDITRAVRSGSAARAGLPALRRAVLSGLAACVLPLLTTHAALAADPAPLPDAPAPAAVPFTWTGAYVGAQLGYLDSDLDVAGTPGAADGFVGGVHLGYDWQLGGNLLLGAYADVDFSDAEIEVGGARAGELDFVARGMAKLGYGGLDRTLLYAQGGIAYLSVDVPGLGDPDLDEAGWAAGVGVDFAVSDKMAVGADYLYHEFDGVGSGSDQFGTDDVDVDAHTVRAKFRYKF